MPAERTTVLFNVATPGLLRRDIRAYAKTLESRVAQNRPFSCLITSDQELRRLNREFRNKDYTTDVLSFPTESSSYLQGKPVSNSYLQGKPVSNSYMQGKPGAKWGRQSCLQPASAGPILGEIAISYPRAKAQAEEFTHTIANEIEILMLHGVLHLLGLDHESDHGQMARAERKWRASLGLPSGLIERMRA
jgi:probable rRNA maturation factor